MFKWIMFLFRKNKVNIDEKSSILVKPVSNQIIRDNDYSDIISKLSLDETFFTPKDITYMKTLSNAQLVYLVLLKQ